MSIIFECERDGQRYVSGAPDAGRYTLFAVPSLYEVLQATAGENPLDYLRQQALAPITATDLSGFELLPCLLPPDPRKGMVCGFGLTHQSKVATPPEKDERPAFFIKGFADSLKRSGDILRMSRGALSACEEAEVVALFLVAENGTANYVGYTFGNDLTDIALAKSKRNYLAYAKLQQSAISHLLYWRPLPELIQGRTSIYREGDLHWEQGFRTGLSCLCYDANDLFDTLWEHPSLRLPGTLIYVYLGADRNSADYGIHLSHGDTVVCDFDSGPRLSNLIEWEHAHV
ncbi:sugar transporter [Pseudomonas kairouanensis]|uniref:Sugar transporter n=1 Tax=Pseudomonas kairouanensis TaxID=2293832 RepID=A0A4Z0AJW3_9PSED|nr:sugar transporter [Pseudomonas kairouanensis]TFY86700.1 sugar transporter [Pseudomonas kairouanensis]